MKYYILEDSKLSKFGGGQKVTIKVIEALRNNNEIFLIDSVKHSRFIESSKKYFDNFLYLFSSRQISNSKTNNFSLSYISLLSFAVLYPINLFLIIKFIKKTGGSQKSLIYCPTKKGAVYAIAIKIMLNINFIFHAHNCYDKKSLFSYLFQKFVISRAKKTIAVSNYVKETMLGSDITVIYNPLTLDNPVKHANNSKAINQNIVNVSTCCSLLKYKGVDTFLNSYRYIQNKKLINYSVIGDGPLKDSLNSEFSEIANFKGHIQDMNNVFSNEVDILVVPSIRGDAFSLVILEAMSYGIPVIATNLGAHKELISHYENGILVDSECPKEIAKWINILSSDSMLYQSISNQALARAKYFESLNFTDKIRHNFN